MRWLLGTCVAAVGLAAIWISLEFIRGDLDRSDKLGSIVSMYVALAGLVVALISLGLTIRRTLNHRAVADSESQLESNLDQLARLVGRRLKVETNDWGLGKPSRLRLRWTTTSRQVEDSPAAILNRSVGGQPIRLHLNGNLDEIVDKFLTLPLRRLVVLGNPGAGKTALVMQLNLGLLSRRADLGGRLPVYLPVSSWNPSRMRFCDWMISRIGRDYYSGVTRIAEQLVADGRIIPVLDGIDEVSEPWRSTVLEEINDAFLGDMPVVLTCRGVEYEAATSGGTVLSGAAVVEIEPLDTNEVRNYLRQSFSPIDCRWVPVMKYIERRPDGNLAAALKTPLMVSLMARVYADRNSDPMELVDSKQFPTKLAVEQRLLSTFISVNYADRMHGRTSQVYSADLAERWLAFIARHLQEQQSRDLAWWMFQWIGTSARWRWMPELAQHPVHYYGGFSRFALRFALFPLGGLVMGLFMGLPLALFAMTWGPMLYLAVVWLVFGALMGAIAVPMSARDEMQLSIRHAVSPLSILRGDRAASLWLACGVGVVAGGAFAYGGFQVGGLVPSIIVGIFSFCGAAITWGLDTEWGMFVAARVRLAAKGHLPLALMTFLEDACCRGVLRRAGAFYQFRHSRLQDTLAANYRGPILPIPELHPEGYPVPTVVV